MAGMTTHRIGVTILTIILSTVSIGCEQSDLRGSWKKSKDGKTYLIVADNNGGGCLLLVDGKPWTHRVGEWVLIEPGKHNIACGYGDFPFVIQDGFVYKFRYWGP
jgi:hypothetical protein